MSVLPKPTPAVPEVQPRPAPGEVVPRRRRRAWPWLVSVALVVLLGALAYQLWLRPKLERPVVPLTLRTAPVVVGPLEQVIRVSGVTSSIRYVNIRAPEERGGEPQPQTLLQLVESGKRVQQGEVLARIDDERLREHINDVQATVDTAEADIRKRRAEQEVELGTLEQNLRVLKSNLDKWKLEATTAEVRTVIDKELLQIGVEEAEARYKQALQELGLRKQIHAAELRILEITKQRHERHRDRHVYDLQRYAVTSPMDGMAVRQAVIRMGEAQLVREGDQLRPGMVFLRVMDVDRMQLEATANQTDAGLIRVGQLARVGLDAFPELKFQGYVYSIGSLAKEVGTLRDYVRTIPVRIRIQGSHPRLIPDLSGYADIVIARKEKALQIPLAAVHYENGESFVWVQRGQQYERRTVQLGMRTHTHAEVLSGLREGEKVLLGKPPAKPAS